MVKVTYSTFVVATLLASNSALTYAAPAIEGSGQELEARFIGKLVRGAGKLLGFGRRDLAGIEEVEAREEIDVRDFEELDSRFFGKIVRGAGKLLGFRRRDFDELDARELELDELDARFIGKLARGAGRLLGFGRRNLDEELNARDFDFESLDARDIEEELEARFIGKLVRGAGRLLGFRRDFSEAEGLEARDIEELDSRFIGKIVRGAGRLLGFRRDFVEHEGREFTEEELDMVVRDLFAEAYGDMQTRSKSIMDELD